MIQTVRLLPLTAVLFAACSSAASGPPGTPAWTVAPDAEATAIAARPVVEVYKSPSCSCCHEWEAYLRANGYEVRSIPTTDVAAVKAQYGVPESAWSCHTAVVDGYAVEGHVPIEAIEDLLERRPAVDAIALPAMPPGSPGMPGVQEAPFIVLVVDDGTTTEFGTY